MEESLPGDLVELDDSGHLVTCTLVGNIELTQSSFRECLFSEEEYKIQVVGNYYCRTLSEVNQINQFSLHKTRGTCACVCPFVCLPTGDFERLIFAADFRHLRGFCAADFQVREALMYVCVSVCLSVCPRLMIAANF